MDNIRKNVFSESAYQQILNAITDMVFLKGDRSNLLWANKAFCEFYGISVEQLRSLNDAPTNDVGTQFFSDDERKVFSSGETLEISLESVTRHDGIGRKFHAIKSPIFDSHGKISVLVGVARDISDQFSAEEKLRGNEHFFSEILDNTPSVIYVKDLAGKYLLTNNRFNEIFSLSKEQVIGKTDHELFPKEIADHFCENDLNIVTTGESLQMEETAPQTDGLHTFISTKFPLKDTHGNLYAVCGISTDITDRVLNEKLLQDERACRVFNAKLALLGEMAGGIAHEVNTPLATLKTLASQLVISIMEKDIDRNRAVEISQIIEATTDRIAKIIKNLRSFTRDSRSDPMMTFSVKKMISDTLSFCRCKFINHQIELNVSAIPDELFVVGREIEISQVIVNLLNNAFDAIETSSTKEVSLDVVEDTENIIISVSDSGSGVSLDAREKIFQPFHTTKGVGKGIGLGLSISKRIIDSHGGTLELDPAVTPTRFIIRLPKHKI